MTIERAEWAPFHVGLVVRDIEAVVAAYGRVLGVPAWSRYDVAFPAVPFDPASTDSLLKVALGKGAGMTWEVIQVASGDCVQGRWLEQHGEGVHHLGFWVTDLQAAVTDAVDAGAGIVPLMAIRS